MIERSTGLPNFEKIRRKLKDPDRYEEARDLMRLAEALRAEVSGSNRNCRNLFLTPASLAGTSDSLSKLPTCTAAITSRRPRTPVCGS